MKSFDERVFCFIEKLKKIHLSRTFWLNAIAIVLAMLNETVLGKLIPPKMELEIVAVLNIANRFITNKPLESK